MRLQLNEKKSKGSQTRWLSWYWKRKPTWRKDLITYKSYPWIILFFNWFVIIWKEWGGGGSQGSFEIGRSRSRGRKNSGRRWTRGLGGPENWTIFMDVMCVSSLNALFLKVNNELHKINQWFKWFISSKLFLSSKDNILFFSMNKV